MHNLFKIKIISWLNVINNNPLTTPETLRRLHTGILYLDFWDLSGISRVQLSYALLVHGFQDNCQVHVIVP